MVGKSFISPQAKNHFRVVNLLLKKMPSSTFITVRLSIFQNLYILYSSILDKNHEQSETVCFVKSHELREEKSCSVLCVILNKHYV